MTLSLTFSDHNDYIFLWIFMSKQFSTEFKFKITLCSGLNSVPPPDSHPLGTSIVTLFVTYKWYIFADVKLTWSHSGLGSSLALVNVVLKRKGEDTETYTEKKVTWRQRQGLVTSQGKCGASRNSGRGKKRNFPSTIGGSVALLIPWWGPSDLQNCGRVKFKAIYSLKPSNL